MNLIVDPWIPVRCVSGEQRMISPLQLVDVDDPAIEIDALRPDFAGAIVQFLIGLLQWLAPADIDDWNAIAISELPLDIDRLKDIATHFDVDGGDRRFMQDMAVENGAPIGIDALLLETAGENTVKNNADLFIKRRADFSLSTSLAVQALLTLQMNAPSGGQGHRTSLRGGGPVSMLLWPEQIGGRQATLWQKLWLSTQALCGAVPRTDIIFPWSTDCLTGESGQDVTGRLATLNPSPLERALLCYFATPRRIRLHFAEDGICSLTGTKGPVATGYVTRNRGADYKSDQFRHPLSPYYRTKEGTFLPVHVRNIGLTYTDWVIGQNANGPTERPASLDPSRFLASLGRALGEEQIRVFGFEMDNMKCVAWHEARFPYFWLDETRRVSVMVEARYWVDGTECARRNLVRCLRAAWGAGGKGDTELPERELYALTEAAFFELVGTYAKSEGLGSSTHDPGQLRQGLRDRWHRTLVDAALRLFSRHAERADVADTGLQAIARIALAQRTLGIALHIELKEVLQFEIAGRQAKRAKPGRATA